jgi:hypothetical protein
LLATKHALRTQENGGAVMGLWDGIKTAFGPSEPDPPDVLRLKGISEDTLSASLKRLPVGGRGWITFAEARSLFSRLEDQYAFGEMDEEGKGNLGAFAAQKEHRSTVEFMPTEGRVYFTRKAN